MTLALVSACVLPFLSNLAGPVQQLQKLLSLMLGGTRLQLIFVVGKVFGEGPLLYVHGSLQLLNSSHVREREKGLLRECYELGVCGNGFLLGRVKGQPVSMSVLWCS